MSLPISGNEIQRLGVVRALEILDTAPDIASDEIGELSREALASPDLISDVGERCVISARTSGRTMAIDRCTSCTLAKLDRTQPHDRISES